MERLLAAKHHSLFALESPLGAVALAEVPRVRVPEGVRASPQRPHRLLPEMPVFREQSVSPGPFTGTHTLAHFVCLSLARFLLKLLLGVGGQKSLSLFPCPWAALLP